MYRFLYTTCVKTWSCGMNPARGIASTNRVLDIELVIGYYTTTRTCDEIQKQHGYNMISFSKEKITRLSRELDRILYVRNANRNT